MCVPGLVLDSQGQWASEALGSVNATWEMFTRYLGKVTRLLKEITARPHPYSPVRVHGLEQSYTAQHRLAGSVVAAK
jgi:hypothetical protein